MIGMVGTNRWSPHGMEVGYCINLKYWGRGYGSEAFGCFLELFWGLEGKYSTVQYIIFCRELFFFLVFPGFLV
jgi:RimJ/RimL family protein N-acetyltransferase